MRLAVLNTDGIQTNDFDKLRYYFLVDDDYDYVSNSATDVTSLLDLRLFFNFRKFDTFINYRQSMKTYYQNDLSSNFGSLSFSEKRLISSLFLTNYTNRSSVLSDLEMEIFSENIFIDVNAERDYILIFDKALSVATGSTVSFDTTLDDVHKESILGINGLTGSTVNLTTDDIPESGIDNLYFTASRARESLSGGQGITYSQSTGVIDVESNEGQVKINDGNGIQPTFTWGGGGNPSANTFIGITYSLPLGISAEPTTSWPDNIVSPTFSNIYDSTNNTFIENTVAGQINTWRIIVNYSGKQSNQVVGVILKIENTLSGFINQNIVTLPGSNTSGIISANLITIADSASLPSPFGSGQGYEFSITATNDLTAVIDSITRINPQKNV